MSLLLTIFGGLMGGGVLSFITFLINRKDNGDDFKEQVIDRLDNVETLGKEMIDRMDKQTELNISEGRAMLDKYNHKFRELGYIPDDRYPIYKSLGEAYIQAGGNSDVKTMFLRNMDKLEVK